jgi:hypothetical protein
MLINKFNVLIVWARHERQVAVLGYVNQGLSYTQLGLQYLGEVISRGGENILIEVGGGWGVGGHDPNISAGIHCRAKLTQNTLDISAPV